MTFWSQSMIEPVTTSIVGTAWSLCDLGGAPVPPPAPTLSFDEADRVHGNAGVNRFGGTISIEGASIRFGPLMSTRMAGPPERMELEQRYLKALDAADRWELRDGVLTLYATGSVAAVFEAAAPR